MAASAHSTVTAFPKQGGSGFRFRGKFGQIDGANVCRIDQARNARIRAELAEGAVPLTKTPDLLLALLVFDTANAGAKREIRQKIMMLSMAGDATASALMPLVAKHA